MLTVERQNIDKAQKEIEKLDAEEAQAPNGTNGDDKAVADVAADLRDASIEEKKEAATA